MAENKATRPEAKRIGRLDRRAETASDDSCHTQSSIIAAAAQAFMEEGFADTSIDAVAQRLSATKGLVYHYYRSKTELFFDVCRHGSAIAFAAVEPQFFSRERAVTRLKRMCEAHVLTMIEKIAFQHVILQGVAMHMAGPKTAGERAVLGVLIAERQRYEDLFRKACEIAAAEGDLNLAIDAAIGAKAILAVVNAPVLWDRPRKAETLGEQHAIVRDLAYFALRGAGATQTILDEEF